MDARRNRERPGAGALPPARPRSRKQGSGRGAGCARRSACGRHAGRSAPGGQKTEILPLHRRVGARGQTNGRTDPRGDRGRRTAGLLRTRSATERHLGRGAARRRPWGVSRPYAFRAHRTDDGHGFQSRSAGLARAIRSAARHARPQVWMGAPRRSIAR